MRIIGHSLLLFLFLAVVGTATRFGIEWWQTADTMIGPNGVSVSRSTAYRVPSSQWLEFGLAERGPVRILSNCALKQLTADVVRYAIDYELLDSAGQIVQSGRYHHRTQITLLSDSPQTDRQQPIAKTSFANTQLPSTNAVEFWIEAPKLDLPGRLRIRIAEHGSAIFEVAVRTYQRPELSPSKAKSAWQRLSRRKREQLARGFAMPSDWLEPFETTALASLSWRPLGPKGVEGQDYEERILFIAKEPEFEQHRIETSPPGLTRALRGRGKVSG